MGDPGWYTADDCRVEDLDALVRAGTDSAEYPAAAAVECGVLIYDGARLTAASADPVARRALMSELTRALMDGPGVLVLAGAYPDTAVVDDVTEAFGRIIAEEKSAGTAPGDHFAEAGANDRVWNALEKLAVADPDAFVRYYANPLIALVCEAWLGAGYQMTSQVNQVNPGGRAQSPHRDYHLGFQPQSAAESYPAHVHRLSPALTLQGAVAHCDMPLESGPTLFLPHSQKYAPGYVAWHLPQFRSYFADHHVQVPLKKGDVVFFNPALIHAAGENRTSDVKRMANLLQVSSPFGRTMETIDRERVVCAVYPALLRARAGGMSHDELLHVIASSAEGYAFPTNLDRDQPSGSDAPASQAELVRDALAQQWSLAVLAARLADYSATRLSH